MGESCFIIPCVKNTKGEDVPSKLFEDLWKISDNYAWTEQQYKIATDDNFLSSLDSEDVVYDRNGQIDARSFLNVTGITYSSEEIKEKLSKRWEDESLPTEEVSSKVSKFNAEEELSDDFIPVIDEAESGEVVKFTIAQRTPDRTAALQSYLENNQTIKTISDRLRSLGVAYDFVGKKGYNGRFSTKNAERAYDGLYHLIEVSHGANIEDTLIEESAHLATLACKDSTFINRLLDALNERNIKSLFTEEELAEVDFNSREGKLELAGKLVAKAMKNQLDGEYKGFLNRVKQSIYKTFAKSDLKSLLTAKQKAKAMAEVLANGFLFDDKANFDVEEAKKTPTTLYATTKISEEAELLKKMFNKLKKLGSRIDNISANSYNDIYKKLTDKAILGDKDLIAIEDTEALTMAGSAIKVLLDRLDLLTKPILDLTEDMFDQNINTDILNAVFEASEIVKTLKDIEEVFHECKNNARHMEDSFIEGLTNEIKNMHDTIDHVDGSISNYMLWYSIAMIRESLGRDTIDIAAGVKTRGLKTIVEEEREISAQSIATTYIDGLCDTNSLISFFRTYSNNKDITTQIFYDVVRKSKAIEAINYNREVSDLTDIEDKWKTFISNSKYRKIMRELGFDPDTIMYERTKSGRRTGYFVGEEMKGQFYEDKRRIIREVKDNFRKDLEDGTVTSSTGAGPFDMESYKKLTKSQKYNLYRDYELSHPKYEAFMKYAYENIKEKKLSNNYINSNFKTLCEKLPEFKDLYDSIIKYKRHIDSAYLTDITSEEGAGKCHGVEGRIPQFKASFINKVRNKNKAKSYLYDTSDLATYCEDVTSDYFGSPITEPVALSRKEENTVALDRLALYGINLLEDPNEMSTDLFKALDKYTEMACRFNTSQGCVAKLEVFNTQLNKRMVSSDIKDKAKWRERGAKKVAADKRDKILDLFVYESKVTNRWKRLGKQTLGALGAFGAIRALCFAPIAGAKNYIAGWRIFAQDVSSGIVEGVTLKDVIKQTLLNRSPKHVAGEIAKVLYGQTVKFDEYQKLVDRWDAYRNPAKIRRRKGLFSLQTLVNIAMANYSVTDNALIGIIYHSMLGSHKLYDVNTGKMIPATDAYEFKNGVPYFKQGILKDPSDSTEYNYLIRARKGIDAIIKNNRQAAKDISVEPMRLSDSNELIELEQYFENHGKDLDIYNESGGYKSAEEVDRVLEKLIGDISFNEDDEYKICNGINDYIISSQGVYGMLNATEFQSNAYTQSLGKIRGYMFGYIQRNFFNNYSVSAQEYKHAMLDSYRLALWSVFSNKELVGRDDISKADYIRYTLTLMVLPFANKSKNLMKHLQRCGWDPDQLKKVANMCLGFWINWLLAVMSRCLYRGNEKTVGDKVYSGKGELPLKYASTGLGMFYPTLFPKTKVIKPGVLVPKRAIYVDEEKAQSQKNLWRKKKYPKNQRNPDEGKFEVESDEWYDRIESYSLRNTCYDSTDPLYYMTGMFYRLSRGIRDEGITLMNPVRFISDVIEMGDLSSSIVMSSGLKTGLGFFKTFWGDPGSFKKWKEKEARFYLNKIGFTYDSTPDDGMPYIQPIDWYDKQAAIDRYRKTQEKLNSGEI